MSQSHAFSVEYYALPDGTYPVEEFILAQDLKMQAKIFRTILLLEQFGNQLREPYSKHLRDGIFELRIKQGSNITRVLYFFVTGQKAILTNGFIKKEAETPPEKIETALTRRRNYMEMMEKTNGQKL